MSSCIPIKCGLSESKTTPPNNFFNPKDFCSLKINWASRHFSVHSSVKTFSCASFFCKSSKTFKAGSVED